MGIPAGIIRGVLLFGQHRKQRSELCHSLTLWSPPTPHTQAVSVKLASSNKEVMSKLTVEQKVLYKAQAPVVNDQKDIHLEGQM